MCVEPFFAQSFMQKFCTLAGSYQIGNVDIRHAWFSWHFRFYQNHNTMWSRDMLTKTTADINAFLSYNLTNKSALSTAYIQQLIFHTMFSTVVPN